MDTNELQQWFTQHLITLIAIGALLIVAYVLSDRLVKWIVPRALTMTQGDLTDGGVEDAELEKRSETIESLVSTLIRVAVIAIVAVIIIGIFELWSLLLVIGLFFGAIVLAGQAIVMDYLMGILLIVEGELFQGDDIELSDPAWKGRVENVGLRRTTVRARDGTVYSISNGQLRMVANLTRIYAAAQVKIRGIREEDLRHVTEIMGRVGQEITQDPGFAHSIMEVPELKFVDDPDELGNIAIMRGKVVASDRWRVATEIRLRLNDAFVSDGIELNRFGVAPGASRPVDGAGHEQPAR